MKTSAHSKSRKRHTRFCGIGIAKRKQVACILDHDGEFVVRSQSFNNNAEGYQQILTRLTDAGGPRRVIVAMEATGHYWYALQDFLSRHRYEVAVLNPIQTAQQAKKGIRKRKTDKIEAQNIATLVKNGEHKPALVPGEFAMTCRQLTRLRYRLIHQGAQLKQLLWSRLHPVWPEYENLFAVPFCKTGRKLLIVAPTPDDVLALEATQLSEVIHKASRGKYGPKKAKEVRDNATASIGARRGLHGARVSIRSLLTQIESLMPIREQLEADITALADQLPGYILTLPGADPIKAVSLFGQTDPIATFRSPKQLVAFAGLDPAVFQSGQYDAPKRRISKRGSPFLRRTLWALALRSLQQEGDLRDYWLRKRREGTHHLLAVTAVAAKLCHIAWRILTDRRDFLPQRPVAKA